MTEVWVYGDNKIIMSLSGYKLYFSLTEQTEWITEPSSTLIVTHI